MIVLDTDDKDCDYENYGHDSINNDNDNDTIS